MAENNWILYDSYPLTISQQSPAGDQSLDMGLVTLNLTPFTPAMVFNVSFSPDILITTLSLFAPSPSISGDSNDLTIINMRSVSPTSPLSLIRHTARKRRK